MHSDLETKLNQPLISVVLPVYNHGATLRAAIDSILSQRGVNLELIVVNDGSTDSTSEVLDSYQGNPRLRIFTQTNKGIAAALNAGFEKAAGTLFTWTSADNLYEPDALHILEQTLKRYPDVDLVYANVRLINSQGEPMLDSSYRVLDQDPSDSSVLLLPQEAQALGFFPDNFINACFLYRRSLAARVGRYRSDYRGFEDYDFWLRASITGKIRHVGVREPLYQYRLHENSLTAQLSASELAQRQIKVVDRIARIIEAQQYYPEVALSRSHAKMQSSFVKTRMRGGLAKSDSRVHVALEAAEPLALTSHERSGWLQFDSSSQLATEPWITPPALQLRTQLLRARETDFGAITASEEYPMRVLVLLPFDAIPPSADIHRYQEMLAAVISREPSTFAVFCSSKQQRAVADSIVLSGIETRRLRIIDCACSSSTTREPDGQQAALLFALSSCELVFVPFVQTSSLLQLHSILLASALAGRYVYLPESAIAIPSLRDASVWEYLTSAPHLRVLDPAGSITHSIDVLRESDSSNLGHSFPRPVANLLDSWLSNFSPSSLHFRAVGMSSSHFLHF